MVVEQEIKVKEIIERSYNVKSFRLEIGRPVDFKAGQFLLVTLNNNKALSRYLSISSSPTEEGYIEFTKKLTDSDFSKALGELKSGDRLLVKYPYGKFILDETAQKIAFLSGGIGITPIRSICKYIVDKNLSTDIALIYANNSIKDIVFKDDFDIMQRKCPKLKVYHILCEGCVGWPGKVGLIDSCIIKEGIPDYVVRKFYLCGPPGMVSAMKKILIDDLFLAEENIVVENFQGYQ